MSLWTPYAQEAALDLSNRAARVEPASSVFTPSSHPSYIKSQFTATALDLRKPSVKVEPVSPVLASCAATYLAQPSGSSVGYGYLSYAETQYYATYPYQTAVMYVPSASTTMMTPDSIGSWTDNRPAAPSPSEVPQEIYDSSSLLQDEEYRAFERDTLQAMAAKTGGNVLCSNPRMRRTVQASQTADDGYRRQRERNNQAARESRNRRKMRELRLATQVTFLQKKVVALRAQLATGGICDRCRKQ